MKLSSMSKNERKLLLILDTNARASLDEISKKLGISSNEVKLKINEFEKTGIIKGYHPVLDHSKIGRLSYRISIKFENLTKVKENEILNYLKSRVNWIVSTLGAWDMILTLYTKDEYEFVNFWNEFYNKFGYYLDRKEILLQIKVYEFEHSFFSLENSNRNNYFKIEHEPVEVKVDETDLKIIQELTNNARQDFSDIAKKINSSIRIVKYRIKNLEKEKIILGYKTFFDFSDLGLNYYKLIIQLKNINKDNKKLINEYIIKNPNVVYLIESLGGYDIDFEVNFEELNDNIFRFISDIREKFPKYIKRIEYVEFIKEHKLTSYNK
ncbi:MAG: winged helix-turn-helix transcriptional regulator [Candidatus Pacearchaeota archaeon]|jgi:Lrp/AsnC family leucine-responsive transcriptional regulator